MLRNVGTSISILMALFASLAGAPLAAHAQTSPQTAAKVFAPSMDRTVDHVPGDLLVKLKGQDALTNPAMAQMMDCFGLRLSDQVMPGWYRLSTRDAGSLDINAASAGLLSTGLVTSAQPNHLYYADVTPNDQEYVAGQQWSLTQIQAEKAWDVTTGSSSIVIAILDTGTATDHPDLQGKFVPGYDMVNNDSNPYDDFGHGTMTAGIAAANSNNTTGIAGISWGAKIMPVKVLDHNGSGSDETLARGIRWAVDHGANIINASLGGGDTSSVQDDAIKYAHDHNVLMVAAAGNTPDGKPHYPAASPYVVAVAATGRSDTVTGFSSYGPYVAVAAPGVGILSTAWDNGHLTYEYGNGTSFSCPIVAGVAALVWSINPQFTADDVLGVLEDSADDVGPAGYDNYTGFGRVNAFKAVQLAQRGRPPTRTPTPIAQATGTAGPTQTAAPQQGPNIHVDTTTPSPGELLAITGGGFGPNEIVDLSLQAAGNSRGLGTAQTNAQGGFAAEVALPTDLAPGAYSLVGQGGASKLTAKVDITVKQGIGTGQGHSVIKGTIRGVSSIGVSVSLNPSLGVSGPQQTTQVDSGSAYSFSGLSSGIYALTATAPGARPAGPFLVQVNGSAKDVKTVDITMSVAAPSGFRPGAAGCRIRPPCNGSLRWGILCRARS